MGQTLTHGVYLPDEGERNCYSGLAANWNILDGAVGTVAEHTAALAGKAPLVHTHSKSDITDFPAYGNTAGTICEGNDSRLSDARTPVAHTHGKADITDLFNSANTWTGNNTFTGNVRPIRLRGSNDDIYNVQPQSVVESQIGFVDKNNNIMSHIAFQHRPDATETHRLCLRQGMITVNAYYSINLNNLGDFYPEPNNTINLGTSTAKWKTLNGINPGALGMIDTSTSVDIDTSGWASDGSTANRVYINGTNPTFPGYLFIRAAGSSTDFLAVRLAGATADKPLWTAPYYPGDGGLLHVIVPCSPNTTIRVYTTVAPVICKYFACLGNV